MCAGIHYIVQDGDLVCIKIFFADSAVIIGDRPPHSILFFRQKLLFILQHAVHQSTVFFCYFLNYGTTVLKLYNSAFISKRTHYNWHLVADCTKLPYFRRLVKPDKLTVRGSDTKTNCCLKFNPKMAAAACQVRARRIVSRRVSFVSRTVEHACYTPYTPFCDPSMAFFTLFIGLFSCEKGYQCEEPILLSLLVEILSAEWEIFSLIYLTFLRWLSFSFVKLGLFDQRDIIIFY